MYYVLYKILYIIRIEVKSKNYLKSKMKYYKKVCLLKVYFVIDLIITVIVYLSVSFIIRCILNQQFNKKDSRFLAIVSSVFGYIVFIILYIIFGINDIPKISVAVFYSYMSYLILHNSKLDVNDNINNELDVKNINEAINNKSITEKRNKKENKEAEFIKEIKKEENKKGIVQKYKNANINSNNTNMNKKWKLITIVLIVINIILIGIAGYEIYNKNNLKTEISNIKAEKNRISQEYYAMKNKVDFFDNYAVIIPTNTKIYHKYDCIYCDKSKFSIFNIENAKSNGYIACSHCIK